MNEDDEGGREPKPRDDRKRRGKNEKEISAPLTGTFRKPPSKRAQQKGRFLLNGAEEGGREPRPRNVFAKC